MTNVVISQSMLFPWVGTLEQMLLADVFIHYDDVKPYYTIFIRSEKKEIQTVAKYLKNCYKTRKKLRCKRSQSKKK